MNKNAALALAALFCLTPSAWAHNPIKLFLNGGPSAGGVLHTEVESNSGASLASGTSDLKSKLGLGLELRFEWPSGFFVSGMFEYTNLQDVNADDSAAWMFATSGMIGFQGTGTIRPWAGLSLGISSTVLYDTLTYGPNYTIHYDTPSPGFTFGPRVGIDWIVNRYLVIGAYANLLLNATVLTGDINYDTGAGIDSDLIGLNTGRWFNTGLRVGISFGGDDSEPAPENKPQNI